jgi:hypothetical protein
MIHDANRFKRGLNYHRCLSHRIGADVHERHRLVTVPGVGTVRSSS